MTGRKSPTLPPERTQDLPVTLEMMNDFRTDIHYRMGATEGGYDARFEAMLREFKADMAQLRADIRSDFQTFRKEFSAEIRGELKTEIQALRTELKSDIQAVRRDLGEEIQAVRHDLGAEIQGVRSDLRTTELKLSAEISEIRADMAATKILVETQTAQNQVVLEGYSLLNAKLDRYQTENNERSERLESLLLKKKKPKRSGLTKLLSPHSKKFS